MNHKTEVPPWDSEIGAIRKSWSGRSSIALVYPNTYGVGMANLGFQSVYRLLNCFDELVCERVFLPEKGVHGGAGRNVRTISVESGRPLRDFDIIAFSISFENDFPNVLTLIENAGLPLQSHARGDSHPLLIAGGVACLLNPEPLAPFIDCFLIGEGEALFEPFVAALSGKPPRQDLLLRLARNVPGAYIPAFYDATYHSNDGPLADFRPNRDVPETVKRVYLKDISEAPSSTAVISSASAFDSAFLTEVSRGCTHGCRFCSAGYVYRPPRLRSVDCLIDEVREGARQTNRIGLVGTAISDFSGIESLCLRSEFEGLRFSYSSLRADAITDGHLSVLSRSGTRTATIAPDAGSERMRRVINKGITEDQILSAARALVGAGIPNLKLYFMIGLPGEAPEDIQAIIDLCRTIKDVFLQSSREKGRMGHITVGVSSFVPKAATPFQWVAMDDVNLLKKKIKALKTGLNPLANIQVNADSPRWSVIQALLARGDRRTSAHLLSAHENEGNWVKTFKEAPLKPDLFIHRHRSDDERFPWDFIDHGVTKSFLLSEYKRALRAEPSPPCPMKNCRLCGACAG